VMKGQQQPRESKMTSLPSPGGTLSEEGTLRNRGVQGGSRHAGKKTPTPATAMKRLDVTIEGRGQSRRSEKGCATVEETIEPASGSG